MATYTVSNLNDSGKGSLRRAINLSNTIPNSKIRFSKNANGSIVLKSNLPRITNTTTIIGNLHGNTPLNTIDGDSKYTTITIYKTSECVINNLCIIGSISGGIVIFNSSMNKIDNCWIGINTSNNVKSNKFGILINNSTFNKIGSNPSLSQTYFSNIISGNKESGIHMINSIENYIKNNVIGLSSACDASVANNNGITLINSNFNNIGGKIFIDDQGNINNPTGDKGTEPPVFVRPLEGNIISGNKQNGILLKKSNSNEMFGNFIGTDNTGLLDFGNGWNGIYFIKSNSNSLYGCGVNTNPFVYYNVIGWNKGDGILIANSNYTTIQGNFLGIGSNNSDPIPNNNGLKIIGNSSFTVLGGIIPLGNVIAGNNFNGIYLTDKVKDFQSVNTFCGLKAFGDALPNKLNGFLIDSNVSLIKLNTNVISGNGKNGIHIKGKSNDILITNNNIGLNSAGSKLPNALNGVQISDRVKNIKFTSNIKSVIGYQTISANNGYGILIENNAKQIIIEYGSIGLGLNEINYISNEKGGILLRDKVSKCEIGDSFNFLYVYDEKNFAVKLESSTFDNDVTYSFINTNVNQSSSIHNKDIINLSNKNNVWGNALPA